MSVESEILRIQRNVADTYAAVASKGGNVPAQPNSANLAAAVQSIPAGAGGTPLQPITKAEYKALTEEEKQADIAYMVTDDNDGGSGGGSGSDSKGEVYSTEETRIGTWIDGKPLYRKTFSTKFLSNSMGSLSGTDIGNVSIVTNIFGTLYRSDGGYIPIPCDFTDGSIAIIYYNGHLFQYPNFSAGLLAYITNQPMYITVEYTKLADVKEVT